MNQGYTRTAIFLHWLMAFGLVGAFALGTYVEGLPFSPSKLKLISWHKWAGMALFGLVVARLIWRFTHRAPELPKEMAPMSRMMAHAGHWLLYALMLAIPLTGWLASSAQGVSVVWLGIWQLPDLIGKNPELGTRLQDAHRVMNYVMLAAVVGHALAAAHHHFIRRDRVLARMLPFVGRQ